MDIFKKQLQLSKIDKEELTDIIYGNRANFNRYIDFTKKMTEIFPMENNIKFYDLNRKEKYEMGDKFSSVLLEHGLYNMFNNEKVPDEISAFNNFEVVGNVSQLMINPLLEILGTEDQKKKWLHLLKKGYIVGAYAQTELGHGSDVQNLKTTATLDLDTNEFVMNNPTIDSIKYWPGELANSSCIAVVYAQLIIKNKNKGVYPFLVEIRDIETHEVKPNIELGDIGPKLGFHSKDNGFLRLKNVRIPKSNIINKFVEIKQDGTLVKTGNDKIIYSAMMEVRTFLLIFSYFTMAKALTIALRYSFVRTQFKDSKGVEIPIINYQLQKFKLFRCLSQTYAILFGYKYVKKFISTTVKKIENKDFSNLQEAHILLSSTKAFYTQWCLDTCNICITACGGHGYSQYSGLPYLVEASFANCILEGENYMLSLQVSRYLIKMLNKAFKGKQIKGIFSYFSKLYTIQDFKINDNLTDLQNPASLKLMLEKLVISMVKVCSEKLLASKNNEKDTKEVWDKKLGIKLYHCSKMHSIYFTYSNFIDNLESVKCNNLKVSLKNLSLLFLYDQIIINSSEFFEHDILTNSHIKIIKKYYEKLLEILSPDIYALIDSFKITDNNLFSAIGSSNGKPYENLYHWSNTYNQVNKSEFQLKQLRKASISKYGVPKL